MSRGLGRIERHIVAQLRADPDNAFTVRELCERIYGEPTEKKHRVSVLRAMRNLVSKSSEFGIVGRQGIGMAFYNRQRGESSEMAAAKLDGQHLLRRTRWSNNDGCYFDYRGKQHWRRATYHYRQLSTRELEMKLRAALASPPPES